ESPENSSEENVVSKTNQEPPQDSNIYQLIDECCEEVREEQKQNMEKTMLVLVKISHHKQFLSMHDDVDDLIESALDSKLLSINSINSQCLDKKEQEVKNVEEQPAERRNLAPILSTREPENSLSMGECEVTSEDKKECDELVCDTFSDSKINDDISVYDDDFKDIEYVEVSHLDPEIVSIEEKNKYDSFCFGIEPDQEKLINLIENDNSDSSNDPLLEEFDLFLSNDSIPPGIENFADDLEGDIRFLEELLI
nr:hypothetical protein [Tanacetum cinerariifolium]